jgi:PhnB protein
MTDRIPRQNLTPALAVRGAAEAIEYYKKAFGAEELFRVPGRDGRIPHAQLRIAQAIFFVSDEFPEMPNSGRSPASLGNTTCALYLYVDDADAVYERAVAAGGRALWPVKDQLWGDREGVILDPFGHMWAIATRRHEVSPEEIRRRQLDEPS